MTELQLEMKGKAVCIDGCSKVLNSFIKLILVVHFSKKVFSIF